MMYHVLTHVLRLWNWKPICLKNVNTNMPYYKRIGNPGQRLKWQTSYIIFIAFTIKHHIRIRIQSHMIECLTSARCINEINLSRYIKFRILVNIVRKHGVWPNMIRFFLPHIQLLHRLRIYHLLLIQM